MKLLLYFFTMAMVVAVTGTLPAQNSWTLQTNPFGTGDEAMLGKIQFVSAQEGWISAGNGKLLHTLNGGTTWNVVSPSTDTCFAWSDPALNLSFVSPTTGWVLQTKGSFSQWQGAVLHKTTNSGATWNPVTIPQHDAGISVQFVDENNGWVLLFNTNYLGGGIYRTTNGGSSWQLINAPISGFPYFKNSAAGWLMPAGGGTVTTSDSIHRTVNGGSDWSAPWGTSNQRSLNAMYFPDVNNGWVVGRSGVILRTTNGGMSWTYVTNTGITSEYNSKAVYFLNANVGWIGIDRDQESPKILHTTNGGASWTIQETPVPQFSGDDIFSIFFWDEQSGWFTADYGRIGRFTGTTHVGTADGLPPVFALYQNYPNPFNPSTTITFSLAHGGFAEIKVFNTLGQEVATPLSSVLPAGYNSVNWDASNVPSGIYFYRLTSGNSVHTRKLAVTR